MRIRSFIIAYALVLAILVFADRRPGSTPPDHYSHVVDLTNWQSDPAHRTAAVSAPAGVVPTRPTCRALPPSDLATKFSTTALLPLPIPPDAAMFLIEARYTIGFAVETPVTFSSDRTLAQQLALHGDYVVEGAAPFTALPATGSLVI